MENKGWENRPPAKLTLEKFQNQDKINKDLLEKDNLFDKNMALMQKDIEEIKNSLETNTDQHKDILETLGKFIESADKKYASKSIEIIVYRVLFGVGIFALLTVVYFIFEKVGLPR